MKKEKVELIVKEVIENYCNNNDIVLDDEVDETTALIGTNRILDSMGLVNIIVDIETAFLDESIEISLNSEAAMSSRISPFRSVGALCNFIVKQL
jgi:acyl carrier protein